jgi:hypothetical protein
MTLDVTIGRIDKEKDEEGKMRKFVVACPESNVNICDPTNTIYPREAERSGSSSFWQFWRATPDIEEIYLEMREYPSTNDLEVAKLKPFAARIAKLKESDFPDPYDQDRLKWLKHWTKDAVKRYGDKAGIEFS